MLCLAEVLAEVLFGLATDVFDELSAEVFQMNAFAFPARIRLFVADQALQALT